MGSLHKRSFGIIMLLLAVVALAPGISIVAGLLLMIPAFQMIEGRPAPVFPRRIAARPLPTRHLAALVQRAVPVLRYLEKIIHPRWPTPLEATKRLVGTVVMILNVTVVFTPIPLGAVVPALAQVALLAQNHFQGGEAGKGSGLVFAVNKHRTFVGVVTNGRADLQLVSGGRREEMRRACSQASVVANVGSGLWVMGGAPADKVAAVGTARSTVSLGRILPFAGRDESDS
jgi:hypothetical protein